jgi:hypothetical protein
VTQDSRERAICRRRRTRTSSLALALVLLPSALPRVAHADEVARARLASDGHKKKVLGASLIAVGSLLDAATTALTFTGLGRGGWSFTPKDTTDKALLWTGVAGNFVLDITLTMGIVVYCQGGDEMRRAAQFTPPPR